MDLRSDLIETAIGYADRVSIAMRDRYGRIIANHQEAMCIQLEDLLSQGIPDVDAIQISETDFAFAERAEEGHNKKDQEFIRRFLGMTCSRIDKFCDN